MEACFCLFLNVPSFPAFHYQQQVPVAFDSMFYALKTAKVSACLQRAECVKQSAMQKPQPANFDKPDLTKCKLGKASF
ncbi:MAG TPA: hypothetical protein VK174_16780 [Chitinophagales bacterium]|nr:hypothetical protein [Chitinophagales bacterium]HLP51068.1 hypothetical protein [Chitinophagales bacterium]